MPAASGATCENRNPACYDQVLGVFPRSGPEDADRAVAAAVRALDSWRLAPAPKRAEILFRVGEILIRQKEEFARQMTQEMGKVLAETRGDVQEAIDMTYYMAGEGRRQFGQTVPSELPNKFAMSLRMPIGACGLITPWNFPMAIPSWKVMPALVCGNTVVLKPATDTPHSALNLVKALEKGGVPPGVVNLVFGTGSEVGLPLIRHKDVRLISFTGSTAVGNTVARECVPGFKHHHLEMGGKNVIIVMDDAKLDLAVDGAIWGGFGTTGQRCTAASRVIVHGKVYNEFLDRFACRARALRIGNGLDASVDMGPSINENQLRTVEETVFADVDPRMRIAQEEIFGPVVSVIPCDDLDSAIEIGNGVVYGLSSAIYTQDVNSAFRAMRDMNTGIFYVNASTIGAEVHLPFGGTKQTGNGHREAGQAALDTFSEWKSIYIDYSGKLQRAQIDT